jgi:hypothetical protein
MQHEKNTRSVRNKFAIHPEKMHERRRRNSGKVHMIRKIRASGQLMEPPRDISFFSFFVVFLEKSHNSAQKATKIAF